MLSDLNANAGETASFCIAPGGKLMATVSSSLMMSQRLGWILWLTVKIQVPNGQDLALQPLAANWSAVDLL